MKPRHKDRKLYLIKGVIAPKSVSVTGGKAVVPVTLVLDRSVEIHQKPITATFNTEGADVATTDAKIIGGKTQKISYDGRGRRFYYYDVTVQKKTDEKFRLTCSIDATIDGDDEQSGIISFE